MVAPLNLRWLAISLSVLLLCLVHAPAQLVEPDFAQAESGCSEGSLLFVTLPAPERGTVSYSFSDIDLTISSKRGADFGWEASSPIDVVMVVGERFGGYWANFYRYPSTAVADSGLEAPPVSTNKADSIAYIQFCYQDGGVPPQDVGCVNIDTHWKINSSLGLFGTAEAWSGLGPLGEDEPFFLSGDTYLGVLWTAAYPPRKGHPYYLLAHEFIAATLNVIDGALPPQIAGEALAAAEVLLEGYTPDQLLALKGKAGSAVLSQFNDLTLLLESFNGGTLGVPACHGTN